MYIVMNEAAEKDAHVPVLRIVTSAWTHTEGKNQAYKIKNSQVIGKVADQLMVFVWVSAPSSTRVSDVSKALTVSIPRRSNPVYVDAAVGKKGLCRFQWKLGRNLANQGPLYVRGVSFSILRSIVGLFVVSLSPSGKCWGTTLKCGPCSSVSIVTVYGLDGPGSNPGGDEIFRPSRPALGPTQPPVQWVPGLSRGKVAGAWHWPPTPI